MRLPHCIIALLTGSVIKIPNPAYYVKNNPAYYVKNMDQVHLGGDFNV